MHKFNNKHSAFSLIELMVTIAIIAILLAVANPVYISYTIKSTISSGLPILESLKAQASEYYTANSKFPANLAAINATSYSDKYIAGSSVGFGNVDGSGTNGGYGYPYCRFDSNHNRIGNGSGANVKGYVLVAFKAPAAINGGILAMFLVDNGSGPLEWYCTNGDSNCPAGSMINKDYLPASCQCYTSDCN
jgi:type IV pilus assembly protein PilE